MSVRRCKQEVSSAEFAGWMAYNNLLPMGNVNKDLRSAQSDWLLCKMHSDRSFVMKIDEFLPEYYHTKNKKNKNNNVKDMKNVLNNIVKNQEMYMNKKSKGKT